VPTLGTLLGEDDPTPTLETVLGTPVEPTSQAREPRMEMAAITGPPDSDPDWWKPISEYLHLGAIPDDETEPRCLACQAKGYLIHDGELYRHNTIGILQRCIPIEEGKALLLDIHESNCGHHASSRSMVKKSFWQGFYWPIAIDNATQIMRSCRGAVLCETDPCSSPRAPDHHCDMAVCHVGPGRLRTLQESTRGLEPPADCDR
jgi:hypothetical protein